MLKSLLTLCIALISFNSTLWAQYERLDSLLKQAMQETQTLGLALAVVKNDKLHYVKSYGLKDLETGEKLETDDMFRIASISKSFTATAILQLVDVKRLNLDDDIGELMGFKIRNPKFPNEKISLKMLLSHTSSINDSEGYFTLDAIHPDKNTNWAKAYNDYAPGSKYQYCNLNFNLLGALLEKVTQVRFDHFITQQILSPLGLEGGYQVEALPASKLVNLYNYDNESKSFKLSDAAYAKRSAEISQYQLAYSTPIFSPTGGMKISAADLAKYMRMHMNFGRVDGKRLLSKKSAQLMQSPLSSDENYGLALRRTKDLIPGLELVGHTGSAYGLFSTMFFHPKEKFGIVLISNGTNGGYDKGFNKILKRGFECVYQEILQ